MDCTQEVTSRLVVARGNGPVLLQACKEVLNQMASFVQISIMVTGLLVRRPGRNDDALAFAQQRLDQPGMGVVSLVCDDGLRGRVFE